MNKILVATGAVVLAGVSAAVYLHAPFFQGGATHALHGGGSSQSVTLNAQPGIEEFRSSPHLRAFYELAVQEFARGPDNVDLAGFEQKSFVVFRELGASMGGSPAAMEEHLKGIPRELIGIVRDDPRTLDSYDNFANALLGPP